MSRLFIELYLDEDVDVLIANLLRNYGYSVISTNDAGLLGATDTDQMEYAAVNRRTIVTHNRQDFEDLFQGYLAQGRMHAGVIIAVRRSPYEIARRLLVILDQVTADEMENQIRYI